MEPKRKIMTLESLSSKSPSRNSPASMQHESGDDENTTSTTPAAGSGDNTEAVAETAPAPPTGSSVSEFSGLVSYFSSQHDDYTT